MRNADRRLLLRIANCELQIAKLRTRPLVLTPRDHIPDHAHREEDEGGVDGGASLAGPVDVAEVEPEGEFVEGHGGGGAVEEGHEAAEELGVSGFAIADLEAPTEADEEEEEDAPDHV